VTPRERLLRTLRGKPADRAPLLLEGLIYPSRAELDGEPDPLRREIAERIHNETAATINWPSHTNRYLVTPPQRMRETDRRPDGDGNVRVTTEIDTPAGPLTAVTGVNEQSRTTWTLKYPVEDFDDVEKIRSIPWELPHELRPPTDPDLPDDAGIRGVFRTGVSSPFVCVAGMMPREWFLELCLTDPELIDELTAEAHRRILAVLDVLLQPHAIEYVWIGGCEWVTPPMASPATYERLVQRYEAEIIQRAHAAGAVAHVHCHGNVRETLELVIAREADYFEPVEPPPDGDITFAEAKAVAAGRITLGGNVEARVLEHGSVAEAEAAARAAFEGGKHRFVLANSAGPISEVTPKMSANYHRLIDVWEELSAV